MKALVQNKRTGAVAVEEVPPAQVRPGTVLVHGFGLLISAGTEKSVVESGKGGYLQKLRQRPDLVRKVLDRVRNEGLWQTYQSIRNSTDRLIPLGYSTPAS